MSTNASQAFLRDLDKKLWSAADRLRANLDAAVYSRVERDSLPKAARRVDRTARRSWNCVGGKAATLAQRMRRADRNLRHHHQARAGFRLSLPPSAFTLLTFPAWIQHMFHHLVPQGSMAVDFVHLRSAPVLLANGSMSSGSGGECPARSALSKPEAKLHGLGRQRQIRQALIDADLVECMVALPGQLFTNTQIPACIWLLTKSKKARAASGTGQISFHQENGKPVA